MRQRVWWYVSKQKLWWHSREYECSPCGTWKGHEVFLLLSDDPERGSIIRRAAKSPTAKGYNKGKGVVFNLTTSIGVRMDRIREIENLSPTARAWAARQLETLAANASWTRWTAELAKEQREFAAELRR